MQNSDEKLLTTKELPQLTGLSESFFEKGRIYGYGPAFICLRGRRFYRPADVEVWMQSHRHDPEG